MESENFGHEHTVVLLNELVQSNESKKVNYCSRCEEVLSPSAPSFGCAEGCGFYMHKQCGEAPLQINHPFHPDHPLLLLLLQPKPTTYVVRICDFCNKECEMFFAYRCDFCDLAFHIKCALFTYNIAEKNLEEIKHVALLEGQFISSKNDKGEQPQCCLGCWEPLANFTYFSLDSGINLHKKCADIPLEVNHERHPNHPLVLQFNKEHLSCKICQETHQRGFAYCCSPCKSVVHVGCVSISPLPIFEDKSHPHPFIPFHRRVPFICDGCGSEGNWDAYICSACNIIVHKKCTSLPRIIKSKWHDHNIFHKYFLEKEDFKRWDCIICHDAVNIEYGSYSCLDCKIIFHVNCVKKYGYDIISLENEDGESIDVSVDSITCVKRNDAGEVIEIKHVKHGHNLMLSDKIMEYDKCCDGCLLPILVPFYYCSQCDFSLHKACAEFPKMKHLWFHKCKQPLILQTYSNYFFACSKCRREFNGFAYRCIECHSELCLRCIIALTPGALTCPGHEHSLLFYKDHKGQCSACGVKLVGAFHCKGCNFSLCLKCFSLPIRVRHKCDDHLLTLTYHDDNNYLEYHYCDVCEEKRDPNYWFYYCETCDNSAHPHCVVGEYPFIKQGAMCKTWDHPHLLTFVRKLYYYPKCIECGKPCEDLAMECPSSGCNYIAHFHC